MASVIIDHETNIGRPYDKKRNELDIVIDKKDSGYWVTRNDLIGSFVTGNISRIEWRFNIEIKNKEEIEKILNQK